MRNIKNLSTIVSFNEGFKTSINLYLNLNNKEKVLGYIPTKSSMLFLNEYLEAIKNNKEQASILIGPYGKGKSHLLLVLLAIASMERNSENEGIVSELLQHIDTKDQIGEKVAENIANVWNTKGRFLPVIITNTQEDLNQAFLFALNDALKREGIRNLVPDTYYSLALQKIEDWKNNYPDTFMHFKQRVNDAGQSIIELKAGLSAFSKKELQIFSDIYPEMTAGAEFNPMAISDPLVLYKNVSDQLVDQYGFSGIYIIFDEFSKYIESQNRNSSGSNMKLLQDMCELANESNASQVFLTLVAHKSIKEYGKYLSPETINAFTGIEGRIVEKFFVTSSKNNYELIKNAIVKKDDFINVVPSTESIFGEKRIDDYYRIPAFKSIFDKEDFKKIIVEGCFPMNPISAYLLLNVSEKVAQNERTLFTFISNDEPNSMARFVKNHNPEDVWLVGADLIYNYFAGLFKKEVINEHVHNEWLNAEYALTKCTSEEQKVVVRALAIILITNKEEEMPAVESVLALATGLPNAAEIIEMLEENQILYKKGSTNSLVFKTRAGSALKSEIKKQRSLKGEQINISSVFETITRKYFVIPRKYNADHAMTRYFRHEYMSVDDFLGINTADVFFDENNFSDGIVISLFDTGKINLTEVRKHVKEFANERMIIICPEKSFAMLKQAVDYDILQDIKVNNVFTSDNEILKRELPVMEEDLAKELREELYSIYEEDKNCKVLYYHEQILSTKKYSEVENIVNDCCDRIYFRTPIVNNEIINRRVLTTGQTKKSRLNIIQTIIEHKDNEEYYSGTNQESTLYRALFCGTGIISGEMNDIFDEILNLMTEYLESCSEQRKSLHALIDTLEKPPYGMRRAIIPIYLSYLLSKRNEDIVVYFSDTEIQISADIIVNMCENPLDYALYMSKADLQKEKYIDSLNVLFEVGENKNLSSSRIKNILICIQRWFRTLPQVTRNAVDYSEYATEPGFKEVLPRIKKLIQKVEANPFELLFVKLPDILKSNGDLEKTFLEFDKCKTFFDDYYDWVLQKAVKGTLTLFSSRKNKDLYHTITEWYENQSELSKNGLHGGRVTNLMSCIEKLNVYDDVEVTKKVIKAVTDVYVEDWNDNSYEQYLEMLASLKQEVEKLRNQTSVDKNKLSFVSKSGQQIEKYYDAVTESTGTVLRNILEDALEEYDDLSINDRVAILLEMIEKVMN